MARIEESVLVAASLAEVWSFYFERSGWPDWVDGFATVVASDGYPAAGSTLRWRSIPAGRGEVSERVVEHEPRRRHLIEFTDPAMSGTLETAFEIAGEATRVRQRLDYALVGRGPVARLGAVLFVRGQLRASMQRSLIGLGRAAEATAELQA